MVRMRYIAAVVTVLCALSCGNGNNAKKAPQQPSSVPFPELKVPGMITEPEERMSYIMSHFWDGLFSKSLTGLCDSAHVQGISVDDVEKQFGIYAALLWNAPTDEALKSVSSLFNAAEACERRDTSSNVFEVITKFVNKYMYDPNSPLRNEEFYLPYVQGLAKSDMVDENMRPAYGYDASMCALNRIGTRAADFSFKNLNGKVRTLYSVNADYTLLFFSNPGCPNCKEITQMIEQNPEIAELEKTGRLKVVNIYIDQELDKWRAFAAEYPEEWISGYDHNYIIRMDQIYNVRAIPSLYLLDREKRVILKDAPQDKVFEKLAALAVAQ